MSSLRFRRHVVVVSSALLALMLIGPAGVSAATPAVIVTGAGPNPATVSYNEPVAVSTAVTNDGTSTFSLKLTTTNQSLVVRSATATGGICATTSPLSCTFKNVKPGITVSADVVLQSPATGTSFDAQFKWDTTGIAGDRGGNSHGDSFYYPYNGTPTIGSPLTVGLNGDAINFRGRYVLSSTLQTVANSQAVDSANKHATKVVAPTTLIGVTVSDGTTLACPVGVTTCFGEASVVSVAADTAFPGGFRVIITMDSSEIPSGVNANNVGIYHYGSGSYPDEKISPRCTFTNGLPNAMPCLNARKINGNDLEITVWVTHNGVMRGLG